MEWKKRTLAFASLTLAWGTLQAQRPLPPSPPAPSLQEEARPIQNGNFADLIYGHSALVLRPSVGADAWQLEVKGEDVYLSQVFADLVDLSVPLELDGQTLPDGEYAFSLVGSTGDKSVRTSGTFVVRNGSTVAPEASPDSLRARRGTRSEPSPGELHHVASVDQVIADDLIVTGKTCTGGNCFDGKTFGVEELLVEDSGGIAEIRIRESTGQQFAFEVDTGTLRLQDDGTNVMTLTDGAPADSIFVASDGDVGLGTSTPARKLEIRGSLFRQSSSATDFFDFNVGSTGMWLLDRDGDTVLKPNHNSSSNTLVLDNSRVGIGTSSPGGNLHIFGLGSADVFNAIGPNATTDAFNFGYSGFTYGQGSGFFNVRPAAGAAAPNPALYFMTGNVERLIVDNQGYLAVDLDGVSGNGFNPGHPIEAQQSGARLTVGGVWTNASSRALKENIEPLPLEDALAALGDLQAVQYNYIVEPGDPQVGFIAEDVPDLVATPDRKALAPTDIVGVLTRVVQEQQKTIDALLERVQQLESAGQ